MIVMVNDKQVEVDARTTVAALLESLGFPDRGIAVAMDFFQAEISPEHGRVPWKILPDPIRKTLLRRRPDAALRELFHQVFDDLPAAFGGAGSSSPSQ